MFFKAILPLLIALAGVLFVSCDSRPKQLKAIDDIIESDPEAALEALQTVDASQFSPDDSAYYALLYTQAQVKCRIPIPSDSLISRAYSRLINSGSDNLRMRVAFYKAQVAIDNHRLPDAMKDILIAYDIAKDHHDHYWIAKTAELIADIYFDSYNFWQDQIYREEAVREYLAAGKILNHRYALCDLGVSYYNNRELDKAINLLDSLTLVLDKENQVNSSLFKHALKMRYISLVEAGRYKEAEQQSSYLDSLIKSYPQFAVGESLILFSNNTIEEARKRMLSAYSLAKNNKESLYVLYSDYLQALASKEFQRAALLCDSLLVIQKDIVYEIIQDAVSGNQRDYYEAKAVNQKQRNKALTYILIIVIISAILITVLTILLFKLKLRARKSEIEAMMLSLRSLKKEYDDRSVVIEALFRDKWSTINMLCDEYFNIDESNSARLSVFNNIEKEIRKLATKKSLLEIEKAVNTYLGNIMKMLREECPFFKNDDYIFMSLVFAGLSARTVCILTGIKYKNYYLKKGRFIRRICDSDAPHKDLFVQKLSR